MLSKICKGWGLVLKRWSFWVTALNGAWLSFWCGVFGVLYYVGVEPPLWFAIAVIAVGIALAFGAMWVMKLPQKSIITVARGPVDGFHEEGR